jgi:hypothetical protein
MFLLSPLTEYFELSNWKWGGGYRCERKKGNENKDRKVIIFPGVKNPACVINALNCCLAVNHIDDELTFYPHYQDPFGEASKAAQKV